MTRRSMQAKETRRKILVAAVRLFARQGYHKTTIADLAQAIGLTTGAVFHHFPSKEDLLEAVVEWLARGIKVYSDATDHVEKPSIQVVHEVIHIMCDHFRRNPEATICLAALATEFAGSDHLMENRLKEVYAVFVDSFGRILSACPWITNPRGAAIAFVGSVQGIAIQGLLREGENTIDELAEAFMTMMAPW
ncbi:MAG: TetR/AcrR family transcriptional regulator [Syntrophobacteraceae bacterium]